MTEIAPSMLSADFGNLQRDVEMVNGSQAAMFHLDVMDGSFVPNISFGFPVIEAIARHATKPLDAHLMVEHPERWVDTLARLGVDTVSVHIEACPHLHRTVQQIRSASMHPAVALNPATSIEMLRDIAPDLDMVLLMSVNPGFGGQKFIEGILDKTMRLRRLLDETGSHAKIQIDGGVNLDTGRRLVDAGADILVAGSFVFGSADPQSTIAHLARL